MVTCFCFPELTSTSQRSLRQSNSPFPGSTSPVVLFCPHGSLLKMLIYQACNYAIEKSLNWIVREMPWSISKQPRCGYKVMRLMFKFLYSVQNKSNDSELWLPSPQLNSGYVKQNSGRIFLEQCSLSSVLQTLIKHPCCFLFICLSSPRRKGLSWSEACWRKEQKFSSLILTGHGVAFRICSAPGLEGALRCTVNFLAFCILLFLCFPKYLPRKRWIQLTTSCYFIQKSFSHFSNNISFSHLVASLWIRTQYGPENHLSFFVES